MNRPLPSLRVAILTTDGRELLKQYGNPAPIFGTAPEALLQGFALIPELEVHVICCSRETVTVPEKLAPNIFFHNLIVPKIGWMSTGYQGCIRAIRRKLSQIQPHLVHGQGTERECAISAAFSGYPNVVTIHGNMAQIARVFRSKIGSFSWLAGKLESFTLKRTEGVFCNSSHTEQLVKLRARRIWRVPNAVRQEFFSLPRSSKPPGKCRVVNVGVVGPGKRQMALLDVARELRGRGLDCEFQFVGSAHPNNAYAKQFLDKIKPLENEGCARYLGSKPLSDLIAALDAAHGMAHFPLEESFGLVVAEALARNLKFFGAHTGGIPEVVAGVSDAELFAVDDWRGLASSIAGWIQRGAPPSIEAAQVMRARYHPEGIARRHVEIYREVLGRAA